MNNSPYHRKRVFVTGIGAVTALAANAAETWEKLVAGYCGIDEIDLFNTAGYRSKTGAQVKSLLPRMPGTPKLWRRLSRCDLFGLIAAQEALNDSGLNLHRENREKIGICLGGGAGGVLQAEEYRRRMFNRIKAKPTLLFSFPTCSTADCIAGTFKLGGFRTTVATACSSSATAIGYAADIIRLGRAEIMLAGGSESLSELTFGGFNSLRLVDRDRCRPFDLNRNGLSLGEGAAFLLLEEEERALSRGADIYAEVAGYAITGDAHHMTTPDPSGSGATFAMKNALSAIGLQPECIDYINAHGTGTPVNDMSESRAIKNVFGSRAAHLPVSSIKSMLGHCLGAAGAIEAMAAVLSVKNDIIPPTVNYETPDPECDLDYVPQKHRKHKIMYAMSNSFAFGGNNTSLIFKKFTGQK